MRLFINLIMIIPLVAFSQEKATTFSLEFEHEKLVDALLTIEKTYDVRFSYQNSTINTTYLTLPNKSRTLKNLLEEIANRASLKFEIVNSRYIIITKNLENSIKVQFLENVVIHGYLTNGITKNKDATFNVDPKKLEILPGLIEPDVLESIQQLPGVNSQNETASSFAVRGGVPDQNRIIWDGINIYHKGHLFGMISPFNPNSTQKVIFINKGTHPRYGERTSSVIDIVSNDKIANNLNVEIGFNAISTDVLVDAPIINNKLSISASLRRSFTEIYRSYTFDQFANKIFQSTKIDEAENSNNDFNFLDYNVRLNYKPSATNSFYLSTISIDNTLDFTTKSSNSSNSFNDLLTINNIGYSAGWDAIWSERFSQNTKAYFSEYRLDYNFKTFLDETLVSNFEKRNVIFDSGVSTESIFKANNSTTLSLGFDYVVKDVGYLFKNSTDLEFILDSNDDIVKNFAAYGNIDYKNSKLFNARVGARINYFESLNTTKFEPRILLYKSLLKNLKLQVSGEVKHQIINEIDETVLSDLSLENKLWRLVDNKSFPIIKENQVSVGFIYSNNGWTIDADHYYKTITNLTALSLGFLNPSDTDFHIGKQKVTGVDVFIKKNFNVFKTWVGYTFTDVKNKYEGINNDAYFVANTNVSHAVNASIVYKKNRFQAALGWSWRTGKPFTKAITTDNGIEFIGVNTERLPNYHRLDISSTYNFKVSKRDKLNGKIGISLRNVYNQENLISREYTGNNTLSDPIIGVDKYAIGFTPNMLFRLYW